MDAAGAKALRDLINRLDTQTDGAGVPRERLLSELETIGVEPETAVEQLNEWYRYGEVYKPDEERVRMTDSPTCEEDRPFSGWV